VRGGGELKRKGKNGRTVLQVERKKCFAQGTEPAAKEGRGGRKIFSSTQKGDV